MAGALASTHRVSPRSALPEPLEELLKAGDTVGVAGWLEGNGLQARHRPAMAAAYFTALYASRFWS